MAIGLNAVLNGAYDLPRLTGVLTRLPSAYHVLVDNAAGAQGIAAAHPRHTFAWRRLPDDNLHKQADPVAWVADMAAHMPDPAVYLYAGNEPEHTAALASWTVKAIQAADAARRALLVLNSAVGNPRREDWTGVLAPVLVALHHSNRWRAAEGLPPHVLGLHEYAGQGDWRSAGYDPLAGDTYLIGRLTWLPDACLTRGVDVPPVWVSENGMDSSDPRYRGWRAIPLTEQQYATGQLGPMDSYYRTLPQPVLGQSVFVWIGDGLGWGEFQVKNAGLLHELIIADQQAKQEVLPPMSDLQSGSVIVHAVTLNVRSGPARSYEKIGSLARTTGPVAAWIGPERTEDGHVWVYIRVGEIAGWAASSVLGGAVYMTAQVDDAPEPPQEPPEEPQEPGEDVSDLTARVAQLEAELQAEKSARAAGEASNRDRWRALASGIRAGGTWFDELGDAVGDGLPESP